jgi:ribonuclease HII
LISGLRDSKELTKQKIRQLHDELMKEPRLEYVVVTKSPQEIDEIGLGKATEQAWVEAGRQILELTPGAKVFLDGGRRPKDPIAEHWNVLPNADAHIPCVMAAAIIAKFLRDSLMIEEAKKYPQYGFESNSGYGTEGHREALNAHGVCPLHRRSYKPVQAFLKEGPGEFGTREVSVDLYAAWKNQDA